MLARKLSILVRRRSIDDLPVGPLDLGTQFMELSEGCEITKRQIDLSLDTRGLVPPRRHPAIDPDAHCRGNGAEDDGHSEIVSDDLNPLCAVEKSTELGDRLP